MAASQPLRTTSCGGVRKANPHGAETAGSREDSVAAQPRRKPAAPLAGRREFLRLEFALQGKDFV